MASDLEKAKLLYKLARSKGNWGGKYERLEHLKRFQDLKQIVKELREKGWLLVKYKKFTGVSLNSSYKKEIIDFIEKKLPYSKGMIK